MLHCTDCVWGGGEKGKGGGGGVLAMPSSF